MRTSLLAFGLTCAASVACGGRTSGDDSSSLSGATGGIDNAFSTGGIGYVATGGVGYSVPTGGSGFVIATGGMSATKETGGSVPFGGKSAVFTTSTALVPTGGKSAIATTSSGGSMIATGGKSPTTVTGGTVGVGTAGGSGGSNGSGGMSMTGGSSALGGSGGTGSFGTAITPITTCNGSFAFLGTWVGNILDYYFNPTESMKLELYTDASGAVAGRLTWGTGSPPPPPQAANIEYPPGYFDQQVNLKPGYMPAEPWSGFTYTILRGAGCDTTFRFGIATNELWQPWCALQTSVYSADIQSWGCVLRGNGGSSDGNNCTVQTSGWTRTYPMWLCDACGAFGFGGVCACDQNGCNADMTVTETFDLTYTVSSAADGGITEILSGPDPDTTCSNCTVRLQRRP